MQFLANIFVQCQLFIQWVCRTQGNLGFYPTANQAESKPNTTQTELLPEATQTKSSTEATQTDFMPTPQTESFLSNQTEYLPVAIMTVDVSQQTDDIPNSPKTSVHEEQLAEQVDVLQETHTLEWDVDSMASQFNLEIANMTRRKNEEIIAKEMEVMQIEFNECSNRRVEMELFNAKLLERIAHLETEHACLPRIVPSCKKTTNECLARLESIREHLLSLDMVTEHSKWTLSYVLEQINDHITSGTSDDPHTDEEKEKLIKDSQTMKSEIETLKLALADAMKTISEMDQRQIILMASECQLKTIVEGKHLLLASKDAELEHPRASVEQANSKPKEMIRNIRDKIEDHQTLPLGKKKDVEYKSNELPPLLLAKEKNVGCGTDDLSPVPAIKETKPSCAGKQSAVEPTQRPKNKDFLSEKVKQSLKGKVEVKEVKQLKAKTERKIGKDKSPVKAESISETVMETLCSLKFPPLAAKKPASSPSTIEVRSPLAETIFASSDFRSKNKPREGYRHNPLAGTTLVYPKPRKQPTLPESAPGFVIITKEIKQTEHRDTLILSDIHETLCGRLIGRGGENVKRMQLIHGVGMNMVGSTTQEEFHNMIIRGGNLEKRRAAAREIIESLPVTIEFPANVHLKKLGNPAFRKLISPLFVKIVRSTTPDDKVTISGRNNDCRKAFELLVNETPLLAPSASFK